MKSCSAVKPLRALILNFSEISQSVYSTPQTLLRVGECASVLKRKLLILRSFDRFAGGRSLTAIVECENLNPTERCILNYFGHCGGFKTNSFLDLKTHKMETIAKKIGASEKTARRAVHSLMEKGYLARERKGNFRGEGPSKYAITEKLFLEYEVKWLYRELNKAEDLGVPAGQLGSPGLEDLGVPAGQLGSPLILPLNSSPSSVIHPLFSSGLGAKSETSKFIETDAAVVRAWKGMIVDIAQGIEMFFRLKTKDQRHKMLNPWCREKADKDFRGRAGIDVLHEFSVWLSEQAIPLGFAGAHDPTWPGVPFSTARLESYWRQYLKTSNLAPVQLAAAQ